MAFPWFSISALELIVVIASAAVAASVAVWRVRSLSVPIRGGLIALIAVVPAVGIGWIVFVSPVDVN